MTKYRDGTNHPLRILLVEDDAMVIHLVRELLRTFGHEVEGVRSAEEAVRAWGEASQPFDLVMADQHLHAVRGEDLLVNLRASGRTFAAVLLGGELREGVDASHPDGTVRLGKPFRASELRAAIRAALNLGDPGPA